ncbi:DeoR/GlpR family DNA-binding transcription regulator [Orbus wheelerorum]|uniref:DeoR/GlpR family DNA-binding transcription regulator n=1 Tax=Orbus wheelerorum TaxID=3074111 RepID=UPI00370DC97E
MARASSALLKRRLDIAEIVRKQGEVKVDELAELLAVSGVTIRQDLTYLEQQGYLKRSFGGAIYLTPEGTMANTKIFVSVHNQSHYSTDELDLVKQSLNYIQDGDTLLLSHGPLIRKLIPFLYSKKSLTLILNDLVNAQLAKEFTSAQVLIIGGLLSSNNIVQDSNVMSFILSQYSISRFIVLADGINYDNELIINDLEHANCYRQIIKQAKQTIAILPQITICDESNSIGKLRDIDITILSRPVLTQYHQQLSDCSFKQIDSNKHGVIYQNAREA